MATPGLILSIGCDTDALDSCGGPSYSTVVSVVKGLLNA